MLLLVGGLVLGALFRIVSGAEHHAYSMGSPSPEPAHVTAEREYQLAIPGGVQAALGLGVAQVPGTDGGPTRLALECNYSRVGGSSQALAVVAASVDTKATNEVGTFTAPATGVLRIDCAGLGAMYVDDADGAADPAGWLLLGAIIALTLGAGLGLSALRSGAAARPRPEAM